MRSITLILAVFAVAIAPYLALSAAGGSRLYSMQVEGPITPLTVELFEKTITRAEENDAEAVIFELDTPGGMLDSTRSIVKRMMSSKVPVVVFVGPNGAHAASAGAFITFAADVAAMAPATNIGAAHPIIGDGGFAERTWQDYEDYLQSQRDAENENAEGADDNEVPPEESLDGFNEESDSVMAQKVRQDTLAWVRSIAAKRGRNIEFAEATVKEALAVTAEEALAENVIDLIAENIDDLVAALDGREIDFQGETRVLRTAGAALNTIEMTFRQKVLAILANPNVAYLLFLLGVAGIGMEVYNPGTMIPGVAGSVSILMALYSFQVLPVNYAGALLVVVGLGLFVLEAKIISYGLLSAAGIVSTSVGALMMFDGPIPDLRVAPGMVISMSITVGAFIVGVLYYVIKAQEAPIETGREALIGRTCETKSAFQSHTGTVFVEGEIWRAVGEADYPMGHTVRIHRVEGLTLHVRSVEAQPL